MPEGVAYAVGPEATTHTSMAQLVGAWRGNIGRGVGIKKPPLGVAIHRGGFRHLLEGLKTLSR